MKKITIILLCLAMAAAGGTGVYLVIEKPWEAATMEVPNPQTVAETTSTTEAPIDASKYKRVGNPELGYITVPVEMINIENSYDEIIYEFEYRSGYSLLESAYLEMDCEYADLEYPEDENPLEEYEEDLESAQERLYAYTEGDEKDENISVLLETYKLNGFKVIEFITWRYEKGSAESFIDIDLTLYSSHKRIGIEFEIDTNLFVEEKDFEELRKLVKTYSLNP